MVLLHHFTQDFRVTRFILHKKIPVCKQIWENEQNEKEFHDGIDIAARKGTSILAALRGNAVEIGFTKLGGHYVILQHSQNYETYYGQCEKILAKKGQAVKKGDIIAICGSSGRSTGPHLHFELRKDGKPIDPEEHIEFH